MMNIVAVWNLCWKTFARIVVLNIFFSGVVFAQPENIASGSWSDYLNTTRQDIKPSQTLVKALALFKKGNIKTGYAVDLGAGTGKDTLYLLKKHWRVLAIDYSSKAIYIVLQRAKEGHLPPPDTEINGFSNMTLPYDIDLINANLALPFISAEEFPTVWQNIVAQIRVGGRFSGNFFGYKDDYARSEGSNMNFVDQNKLKQMFAHFHIESLALHEGYYSDTNSHKKYWQIWDVVAKKID